MKPLNKLLATIMLAGCATAQVPETQEPEHVPVEAAPEPEPVPNREVCSEKDLKDMERRIEYLSAKPEEDGKDLAERLVDFISNRTLHLRNSITLPRWVEDERSDDSYRIRFTPTYCSTHKKNHMEEFHMAVDDMISEDSSEKISAHFSYAKRPHALYGKLYVKINDADGGIIFQHNEDKGPINRTKAYELFDQIMKDVLASAKKVEEDDYASCEAYLNKRNALLNSYFTNDAGVDGGN